MEDRQKDGNTQHIGLNSEIIILISIGGMSKRFTGEYKYLKNKKRRNRTAIFSVKVAQKLLIEQTKTDFNGKKTFLTNKRQLRRP